MCKVVVVFGVFHKVGVVELYPRKRYVFLGRFNICHVLGPIKRNGVMCIDDDRRVSFVRYFTYNNIPVVYYVDNVYINSDPREDECAVERVIAPFLQLGMEEVAFVDVIKKRGAVVDVGLDLGVPPAYETDFKVFRSRVYAKIYRVKDLPKPEEIRAMDWCEIAGNKKTKSLEGILNLVLGLG